MRSFYLQIQVYAIEKWPFSGTFPLIYSNRWSFYKMLKDVVQRKVSHNIFQLFLARGTLITLNRYLVPPNVF